MLYYKMPRNNGRGRGRPRTTSRMPFARSTAAQRRGATTIQRAYRQRRNFRPNLQPFVETKDRTTFANAGTYLDNTKAYTLVAPDAFLFATKGISENQIIGSSCYSRYLSTKMLLEFPQQKNMLTEPCSIEVYQLWVKAPLAATKHTATPANQVTSAQLEKHIEQQVEEFFDTKSDRMEFHDASVYNGVKIIKKQKVRISQDNSIVMNPVATVGPFSTGQVPIGMANVQGSVPDWFHQFSWTTKTKLHYEESTALAGVNDLYMNRPPPSLGYPVLVIYNPNFATQAVTVDPNNPNTAVDRRIKLDYRSKHWYGDQ